jgi:recombination endonuclease VII
MSAEERAAVNARNVKYRHRTGIDVRKWPSFQPAKILEYQRRYRYGVEPEVVVELLARQANRCAICGAENPKHLDHDHATAAARGMLCRHCNAGLGYFRDDPGVLERAAAYLRGSGVSQRF